MKNGIAYAILCIVNKCSRCYIRGDNMSFSEFVISVRKGLGLSQKQLAVAISVSYTTINRWENGHVIPSNLAIKSFYDFCENNFIEIPDGLL